MEKYSKILFILSFIILSCNNNVRKTKVNLNEIGDKLTNSLSKISPNTDISDLKSIVVIPGTGCSGCISSVEFFIKDQYKKHDNIRFILTSIQSKKLLRTKVGLDLSYHTIILDTANVFSRGAFESIYPTFYFLNNGKLTSIRHASLKDDGLSALVKILNSDTVAKK